MTEVSCLVCQSTKAHFNCGICAKAICKKCVEFQDVNAFSFMREIPENLRHPHYCPYCFVSHILPARATYYETMERAKKVTVFDKPRRRQPHYSAYSKSKLIVEACEDKSVTLMRLAYLAAEQGYNAVTRVNIRYEKVRDAGGYQTTLWSGTGFAATIDGKESGL